MDDQKLRIRRAQRDDAAVFLDMVDALADYEKMSRLDAAARQRLTRDAFDRPRFEIYLAEVAHDDSADTFTAVGYAVVLETYSTFRAQPTLFLEDLFVRPEYRRQGIGLALFRHCVQLAQERQCGRMEWLVLHWNQPALAFYQRFGNPRLREWLPFRLNYEQFPTILKA